MQEMIKINDIRAECESIINAKNNCMINGKPTIVLTVVGNYPKKFPRPIEFLSESERNNGLRVRNYAFDPAKVLKWLDRK